MRTPCIYVVVPYSEESIIALRARYLMRSLEKAFKVHYVFKSRRKAGRAYRIWRDLRTLRPALVYAFKVDTRSLYAACIGKAFGAKVLVDTGDVRMALTKARGAGFWSCQTEGLIERSLLRSVDGITVRGTYHKWFLEQQGYQNIHVIPDGVDPEHSRFIHDPVLRRRIIGDRDVVTVGVMGTTHWNARRRMCYGWELIEVLHLLRELPLFGILVGDGSGLPYLKAQAKRYEIEDRMAFVGRIPYGEVPRYVSLMDIAISTQTNDLVGQVRTTGKLPEYLACGRYVLATRVGEAKLVLPDDMLVDYEGSGRDEIYPQRLARRIQDLIAHPDRLKRGWIGPEIVRERFDYGLLSARIERIVEEMLEHAPGDFS